MMERRSRLGSRTSVNALPVEEITNSLHVLNARGLNVRFWHKADIEFDAEHVRFREQSGHL
jgi:hypothetical protein